MDTNHFSLLCLNLKGTKFSKGILPGWYFFNDKYILDQNNRIVKNTKSVYDNFYGSNISISAIVGKNGSGKSALLEIIYRIIYHWWAINIKSDEGVKIKSFRKLIADLYFSVGEKVYFIRSHNKSFLFDYETMKKIDHSEYANLFYTVVTNFAINTLNPNDYENELGYGYRNWVSEVYLRNKSILFPLNFCPNKMQSSYIFSAYYKNLTQARLSAFFLCSEKYSFRPIDNYHYSKLCFSIDCQIEEFLEQKYNCSDFLNFENDLDKSTSAYMVFSYVKDILASIDIDINYGLKNLAWLLFYEFIQCINKNFRYKNPCYLPFLGNKAFVCRKAPKNVLKALKKDLEKIDYKNNIYATGIRQIINFYCFFKNTNKKSFWWNEYLSFLTDNKDNIVVEPNQSYIHTILEMFPPMLFKPTMYIRKNDDNDDFELWKLSTGEIQCISFYYEVLSSIHYIKDKSEDKYRNINLIFDEIELSFHPEFQRKFIKNFLNFINSFGICNMFNLNVLLVTHSPFILSDIPSGNILHLDQGIPISQTETIQKKTFGANIYDILNDGFFMESNMGAYVEDKIDLMINTYHKMMSGSDDEIIESKGLFMQNEKLFEFLKDNIAERYLKKTIGTIYEIMNKEVKK